MPKHKKKPPEFSNFLHELRLFLGDYGTESWAEAVSKGKNMKIARFDGAVVPEKLLHPEGKRLNCHYLVPKGWKQAATTTKRVKGDEMVAYAPWEQKPSHVIRVTERKIHVFQHVRGKDGFRKVGAISLKRNKHGELLIKSGGKKLQRTKYDGSDDLSQEERRLKVPKTK